MSIEKKGIIPGFNPTLYQKHDGAWKIESRDPEDDVDTSVYPAVEEPKEELTTDDTETQYGHPVVPPKDTE